MTTSKASLTSLLRETLLVAAEKGESHEQAFEAIAELLLCNATLYISQKPFRLTEIEIYWSGLNHEDPFVHKDPHQAEFGRFYFHRQGKTYKGGTYKGVDIAVGDERTHAGILIRALLDLETNEYTEGSCSSVDLMLTRTAKPSVADLAQALGRTIDPDAEEMAPLFFKHEKPGDGFTVLKSARVGLTLKKGATDARKRFLGKHYRFLSEPAKTKKGRPNLVLALYQRGASLAEIQRSTSISASQIQKYIQAFERGKTKQPEAIQTDMTPESLSELLGALHRVTMQP